MLVVCPISNGSNKQYFSCKCSKLNELYNKIFIKRLILAVFHAIKFTGKSNYFAIAPMFSTKLKFLSIKRKEIILVSQCETKV